jgi:cell division protein FtsW
LILLYVAGTRASWVLAAIMVAAPLAWSQIVNVGYRRERVESFLSGDDYQVEQGLIAIGSGGPFGRGLGNGRQKLGFLPENHTDFILATIGEELGVVGIFVVLGLFAVLVWRGVVIARQAQDRFGTYLALGLAALFGLQALINMAVVLSVMPAKGITLPFVSYGGSSLLVSMASIGVLLSISRRPVPWAISDMRGRRRPERSGHRRVGAEPPRDPRGARANVRKPCGKRLSLSRRGIPPRGSAPSRCARCRHRAALRWLRRCARRARARVGRTSGPSAFATRERNLQHGLLRGLQHGLQRDLWLVLVQGVALPSSW